MSSDFQKRMFGFQAKPPSHAWDEIAAALDKDGRDFPDRLFRFQQMPPESTWQKISNQLGAVTDPHRSRLVAMDRRKMMRYSAVAAVILLAAISIFLLFPRNQQAKQNIAGPATNKNIPPVNNSAAAILPQENGTQNSVADGTAETAAASGKRNFSRHATARLSTSVQRPQKKMLAVQAAVTLPEKNMVNAARDDRYMIATANDGSVVRLPKKAYADFACVNVTDVACREKIASMRNKMATASVTTDFAGFLDLLNNLENNQ